MSKGRHDTIESLKNEPFGEKLFSIDIEDVKSFEQEYTFVCRQM